MKMMTSTVYLLWCNDRVLSVHGSVFSARRAQLEFMKTNPSMWLNLRAGRFFQKDGPIARLEIEPWDVINEN